MKPCGILIESYISKRGDINTQHTLRTLKEDEFIYKP